MRTMRVASRAMPRPLYTAMLPRVQPARLPPAVAVVRLPPAAVRFPDVQRRWASSPAAGGNGTVVKPAKPKKPVGLGRWLWDQVLHVWYGFKLLAANTKVAVRLRNQVMKGQKLTRRERLLLERTTADLLRLIPFSLFIIIPAGELLLPVALAMFPNLMPSTFVTDDQRRMKQIMENLGAGVTRRRLFDHMTATIIAHEGFSPESQSLQLFRTIDKGGSVSAADIRSLVPYFQDDGPMALSKLPGYVVREIAKLTGNHSPMESSLLPRSWYEVRMRHAIANTVQKRDEDDRLFAEQTNLAKLEGQELEAECVRRRMRWFGPKEALQRQLREWLELSLDDSVPDHLLLFIQPCATHKSAMLDYLSKSEIDHILGLDKFRDTRMQQTLRSVTSCAEKRSRERIEQAEDDIDGMVSRLEEIQKEDKASEAQFADLARHYSAFKEEEMLAKFDELAATKGRKDESGQVGVEVGVLSRGMVELAMERSPKMDWPARCSELTLCIREFDHDVSDVIVRDEFQSFLSRIQMECDTAGSS